MPTAQETQAGVAKIFGLRGATISGTATVTIEDASLEHGFNLDELEGQDGNTESMIAYGEKYDIVINFAPNGGDRTAAIASAAAALPTMLAKVTLSAFAVARFNTDYHYVGGGDIKMTKKGPVMMGLKLRRHIVMNSTSFQNAF